jgi:hypothetical protein
MLLELCSAAEGGLPLMPKLWGEVVTEGAEVVISHATP